MKQEQSDMTVSFKQQAVAAGLMLAAASLATAGMVNAMRASVVNLTHSADSVTPIMTNSMYAFAEVFGTDQEALEFRNQAGAMSFVGSTDPVILDTGQSAASEWVDYR
jgi:hypothetical protein